LFILLQENFRMTQFASRIDVRTIAPQDRHPMIFSTFRTLGTGQALELVNNHDPQPLRHQFNAQVPGEFTWDYLEQGPQTWRVAITRVREGSGKAAGGGSCCGSCGG
jgi:uncharacterized protein (DUF2249 family)